MSMMEWAKDELNLYFKEDDDYSRMVKSDVLEVLRVLCNQGHTGLSASIVMGFIKRLWKWKPLTPLTGEDDEWNEVAEGVMQNKRCSAVFKRENGAYYLDGRCFTEPPSNDITFTTKESSIPVTFPFTVPDKTPIYHLKHRTDDMSIEEQLAKGEFTKEE